MLEEYDANMLVEQQALAPQQNEAAQSELRSLYESRLSDLQKKYNELEISHVESVEKQNAEMSKCRSHYEVLKRNYDTLLEWHNYYSQQNNMLFSQQSQYQGQIKCLEDKYNALKQESDSKIGSLQHKLDEYINKWKAEQQANAELISQMELMKQKNNARISQMSQELLLTEVGNPVTMPTLILSSASTPPPKTTNSARQRKCIQCGGPCRRVITIPYCNENCKHGYL